jgi:hypothetical protein
VARANRPDFGQVVQPSLRGGREFADAVAVLSSAKHLQIGACAPSLNAGDRSVGITADASPTRFGLTAAASPTPVLIQTKQVV